MLLIFQLHSLTSSNDMALIETKAYNKMKTETYSVQATPSNGVKTESYNLTKVQFLATPSS